MKDSQSKKLFILAMCILLSAFGIFFTFFGEEGEKSKEKNKRGKEEKQMEDEYDYSKKPLPEQENESDDESYTEGRAEKVYFTNARQIDESSLPISVHAVLRQKTQEYLYANGFEDVTEVSVIEEGCQEDEESVTFQCRLPKHEEILKVTYQKKENILHFETIMKEEIRLEE